VLGLVAAASPHNEDLYIDNVVLWRKNDATTGGQT
jgi:hypothetical protein